MPSKIKTHSTGADWRTFFRRFFWTFVLAYLFVFLEPHYCGIGPPRNKTYGPTTYYELQTTWKWAIPIAFIFALWHCWRMESKDK